MKAGIVLAILAAVAITSSYAASIRVRRQLIPPEFRNVKIEDYLKNPRSVAFQLKCIVYDGPCDRIGKYLKVTIPELISGTCSQCTPSDRQIAGKLVSHIQKNFPKEWHDAVKKFQGGQSVKPEDASRLESLLGVKIDSDLVASSTTAAPAPVAPSQAPVAPSQAPVAPSEVPQVVPAAVAVPQAPVVPVQESQPQVVPGVQAVPVQFASVAVAPQQAAAPVVPAVQAPVNFQAQVVPQTVPQAPALALAPVAVEQAQVPTVVV